MFIINKILATRIKYSKQLETKITSMLSLDS